MAHRHGPGAHVHGEHSHAAHSHGAHGDHDQGLSHRLAVAPPNDHSRGLRLALALTAVFLVAEVIGGLLSHSLALLADAGHMLTDVAALGLSLFVTWFSQQPETPEKTYGYLRWEILAALLNGATLLAISVWIIGEAVVRLRHPRPVESGLMLGVAAASVVTNVASAWLLHGGSRASLNLRGAYMHVLGDLLGSVGTVVAALLVRYTGWLMADPLASIIMTVLLGGVRGGWCASRSTYC